MNIFSIRLLLGVLLLLCGCGRPDPAERYQRPSEVTDFKTLYQQNCSGCHGKNGNYGVAPPINDALFQAIITDEQLTKLINNGRSQTLMPAFARSQGGSLTDQQVSLLVQGIRKQWDHHDSNLLKITPPEQIPGYQISEDDPAGLKNTDLKQGADLFAAACSGCHGLEGKGSDQAGPLNEIALGNLISDQLLRRIIITGRPDLNMPDFHTSGQKSKLGHPLTSEEIVEICGYVRSIQQVSVKSIKPPRVEESQTP